VDGMVDGNAVVKFVVVLYALPRKELERLALA
jgi:hypothetical protein